MPDSLIVQCVLQELPMKKLNAALVAVVCLLGLGTFSARADTARDYISIVGSSTIYPFATVVAETFGKKTHYKVPKIESTGSGGGHKLFGAGIGVRYPDITNASARITRSQLINDFKNGVKEVVEVKIGYDGIVVANSKHTGGVQADPKRSVPRSGQAGPGSGGNRSFAAKSL